MLTPAGSVEHRLPSGDSGFDNLVLAGDWTANGIDGGCVEAAVISGMDAARGRSTGAAPADSGGRAPSWLRPAGPGAARLRRVRRARHRARARSPARAAGSAASLLDGERRAHRRRSWSACSTALPAARSSTARSAPRCCSWSGASSACHLADPAVRPLGRRARDPGLVLDPGAGRAATWRAVRCRAPAAGRAVHLRGQPDVLPRGPRGTTATPRPWGASPPRTASARPTVRLEAFGGDFGRDEGAAWRKFLEVEAIPGPAHGGASERDRRSPRSPAAT